ncbi:MAG: ABC transporter ATP-binding protein [Candidatus Competibacterales bacterium]
MTSAIAIESTFPAGESQEISPVPRASTAAPVLNLQGVCKGYGRGSQRVEVLRDINLQVKEGEFVAIVGFSGSGKTTLISTMAGLLKPDSGRVTLREKPITGPGPDRGIVFQNYSLLPWMTVRQNVALAVVKVHRRRSKQDRGALVGKYVNMVNLGTAMEKRPAELSGGMRQRVAVARALAMTPEVLLLDEPLSALDALTRAKLQDEILKIWQQERKTVVLITNDVDEALIMADRVIPLNPGPNATFGPEFVVDLSRPRDRTAINHDQGFITLRREITQYLIRVGIDRGQEGQGQLVSLPNAQPITSRLHPKNRDKPITVAQEVHDQKYVEFVNVSKVYPTQKGSITVVEDFNLRIKKGEFISIIGHSGCGKSTVLSMMAGLNSISDGGIVLDGKEITYAGPDRGIVFQAPSLFPWLTAFENVSLGVEKVYPHLKKGERCDIIAHYLERVGLADAMAKRAADLSNGMKQRVGIARAFALSPKLLLLDEPFGMLDSLTRWELQEVLMEVWSRTKVTAMIVTHDVDEAILLADRVIMMTNGPRAKVGKIQPVDLPRPRSRKALLEHPDYYDLRESLLTFLNECEHTH